MLPRCALVALLLAPPASAADATTYIGVLPAEPPARIAVVLEGDAFLAYACGKTDEFNQAHSGWFKGKLSNGRMEATVGDKTFTATLEKGAVRGSLATGEGRGKEFTAKPVAATALAGLYRATREVDGDPLVLGWIVDAKHQVAGGCQGKKRKAFALQPKAPLPPPPPADELPPAEQQQAEEFIVQQVDADPGVAVQGEKVKSAVNPPAGKLVRAAKK